MEIEKILTPKEKLHNANCVHIIQDANYIDTLEIQHYVKLNFHIFQC